MHSWMDLGQVRLAEIVNQDVYLRSRQMSKTHHRMVGLWITLSRLMSLLIAGALFAYAVAIMVSAVSYYRSTQKVSAEDVRALEELTTKLDNILQIRGTLASVQAPIDQKNAELKEAIKGLRQANTQPAVVSNLDTVSANLSFLSEMLKNERSKGSDVVGELHTKVAELKAKAGPRDGADRIVATFLRDGGKILLAIIWPLLLVVLVLYLLKSRSAPETLRKFLRPFKSVKLFEAELVLSDEAKTMAEGTFEKYRKQAVENYDLFVQRKRLAEKFENVVTDVAEIIRNKTGKPPNQYRCTLHVPDLVFADTLYQLLDYMPNGAGSGRIFSIRFGLIGRVWRSRKSEIQKLKLETVEGKEVVDQNELIRIWGMSKREAQTAAEGRPSFLCVMLATIEGDPVGLFYMDSKIKEAFDIKLGDYPDLIEAAREQAQKNEMEIKTKQMLDEIVAKCHDKKIIEILAKMSDELGGRAPLIRIYEK
jgi:hypothetical protein